MYKIKNRKPEEMKDSGVDLLGVVPRKWRLSYLKYILKYQKGKNPKEFTLNNGSNIPYVSADYLRTGQTDNYVEITRGLIKTMEGDLLLLWDGANAGEFFEAKNGILGSTFARLESITNDDYDYLKYYAKSYSAYLKAMTVGMGIPHVNTDILKNLIIYKPIDYKEQKKIANFLDIKTAQFDSIISKKEKLIEKLEEAKKSLISEVVTGKVKIVDGQMVKRKPEEMKDSGVEWLGVIPKEWEVKKLKYIAFLKSGETITNEAIEQEGPYPVYGGNGLRGYTNKFTHKGKHILIGRQGALCGNINYAENKFWASEHAVVVNIFTNTNIIWLGELLRSMELNQYSISAAQPGLSVWRISNLHIPYPPKNIQDEISIFLESKLKEVEDLIMSINIQIQKLKEAKQSLISEAVTGKIDLRDWEITEEGGA